jgi:hypothetical protein
MFWHTKGNHRYLVRSRREGDKIERDYLGTGPKAELLYEEYRRQKEAQQDLLAKVQRELDAAQPAHSRLADFSSWTDLLTRAILVAAGYYLHHRHEWRPRGVRNQRQEG